MGEEKVSFTVSETKLLLDNRGVRECLADLKVSDSNAYARKVYRREPKALDRKAAAIDHSPNALIYV